MNVSKHLHSCLIIEHQQKTVLIDPGNYTYQEKALSTDMLTQLDYLLITHEHPDHMYVPFVKDLAQKFPQVHIVSNPSVAEILEREHLHVHTDLSTLPESENIQFEDIPHENLWDKPTPQHVAFTLFDKLTHAGDSHHIQTTADVLALPLQAPWGSTREAVELALRLKPKIIIPIHDWMWKDEVRRAMYQRLQEFFKTKGIDFTPLETGEVVEV